MHDYYVNFGGNVKVIISNSPLDSLKEYAKKNNIIIQDVKKVKNFNGKNANVYISFNGKHKNYYNVKYKINQIASSNDNWITGKELYKYIENCKGAKRRYVFKELRNFIDLQNTNYICALYGLRRTGKTFLIYQAIDYLINEKNIKPSNIAFISLNQNTDYDDDKLVKDISNLNCKYIFIDEISYIKLKVETNSLNALADTFAATGKKIVIAGTFSYLIDLLSEDTLFDRILKIDTNTFSFKEAHDVFRYNIDDYIQYGGILKNGVKEIETPKKYKESALITNISKSLMKSDKVSELLNIDDKDENRIFFKLSTLVRNMIDRYMQTLMYGGVIKSNYKYTDAGQLSKNITMNIKKISQGLNSNKETKEKIYNVLHERWMDVNPKDVSEESFNEIIKILMKLGIVKKLILQNTNNYVFISNYLRYGLCEEIIEIVKDEIGNSIGNVKIDEVLGNVKGYILETIVQLDMYNKKYKIDKYRNDVTGQEFDLININDNTIDVFEIKHSDKQNPLQLRHMVNKDFIKEVENYYGKKVGRYIVLYRGKNETVNVNPAHALSHMIDERKVKGEKIEEFEKTLEKARSEKWGNIRVEYINVEDFLLNI